jgi:hypothetical protein
VSGSERQSAVVPPSNAPTHIKTVEQEDTSVHCMYELNELKKLKNSPDWMLMDVLHLLHLAVIILLL